MKKKNWLSLIFEKLIHFKKVFILFIFIAGHIKLVFRFSSPPALSENGPPPMYFFFLFRKKKLCGKKKFGGKKMGSVYKKFKTF